MKITYYIPVVVEIADPVAALDNHIENWQEDDPDVVEQDSAHPADLLSAAIRLDGVTIAIPEEADDPDWVYMHGHIADDWDMQFSRSELEELE